MNGFLSAVPQTRIHSERDSKDGKWKVRKQKYNPFTVRYLQYSWGVGVNYASRSLPKTTISTIPNDARSDKVNTNPKCVINDRNTAKAWYTPRCLFMQNQVARRRDEAETLAYESAVAMTFTWTEEAKAEWVLLSPAEKEEWNFYARNHDERHQYICDHIVAAIRRNPTWSFQKIAADIDYWCSTSAIHRWLSSHTSYSVYVERILPLLSKVQMQKHVGFAKVIQEYRG